MLAVLVLAALTLITIDARGSGSGVLSDLRNYTRDVFSPLQRATHAALDPVGNFLTGALDYGSLRKENERLRAQLSQDSAAAAAAQAEQQQAAQIEAQAGIPTLDKLPQVTALVIDDGSSNFDFYMTLGQGTSAGIGVGDPVVASGALIGQIESASKSTAMVKLITDPSFNVGVKMAGGNVGTLTGQGLTQPLRVAVDTTSKAAPVEKVGDRLVTSGLSMEQFPPNIPVATVSYYRAAPGQVEPTIRALPLVSGRSASTVQVVIWSSLSPNGAGS